MAGALAVVTPDRRGAGGRGAVAVRRRQPVRRPGSTGPAVVRGERRQLPAVAQICNRLDGIPLAVELAAARCRHLSSEQIAAELDDRFQLLTGGPRFVLPRQQTLAASVEWSFDLLDDMERRVLRRLGVFAGPFSLQAAEAVASAPGDGPDRSLRHDQPPRRQEPGSGRGPSTPPATGCSRRSVPSPSTAPATPVSWPGRATPTPPGGPNASMPCVTGPTDEVIAMVDAHHEDLVAARVLGRPPRRRARAASAVAARSSLPGHRAGR